MVRVMRPEVGRLEVLSRFLPRMVVLTTFDAVDSATDYGSGAEGGR